MDAKNAKKPKGWPKPCRCTGCEGVKTYSCKQSRNTHERNDTIPTHRHCITFGNSRCPIHFGEKKAGKRKQILEESCPEQIDDGNNDIQHVDKMHSVWVCPHECASGNEKCGKKSNSYPTHRRHVTDAKAHPQCSDCNTCPAQGQMNKVTKSCCNVWWKLILETEWEKKRRGTEKERISGK
jgi:hypothetical protein